MQIDKEDYDIYTRPWRALGQIVLVIRKRWCFYIYCDCIK